MATLTSCAPVFYRVSVVVDGQADVATAFISSGNYYRVLGLTANPGRTIMPADDQPAAPPVAVISARYWRARFGGDPHVIDDAGVVIGLGTAVAARRLVATLLFGVAATDGLTIVGAVTLMVLVSAVAGYVPARRAARVDPLVALHHE